MGLKNLIAKITGKAIAKKLDLKETKDMDNKKQWWKSKAVLTGIVTIIIGAYETARISVAPQMGWNLPEIPPVVYTLLGGIGIYSRVVATKQIG